MYWKVVFYVTAAEPHVAWVDYSVRNRKTKNQTELSQAIDSPNWNRNFWRKVTKPKTNQWTRIESISHVQTARDGRQYVLFRFRVSHVFWQEARDFANTKFLIRSSTPSQSQHIPVTTEIPFVWCTSFARIKIENFTFSSVRPFDFIFFYIFSNRNLFRLRWRNANIETTSNRPKLKRLIYCWFLRRGCGRLW